MSEVRRSELKIKRGITNTPSGTISNIVVQQNGVVRIKSEGYKRKGKFTRQAWKS